MSKKIKCNECGEGFATYPVKGKNNTYLCGGDWMKGLGVCGNNSCSICGKIETRTEWVESEDCCGNKIRKEQKVSIFSQLERDENDSDRAIRVNYCEEHKQEGLKSFNKWTEADDERLKKKEEQKKQDIVKKLDSQKGLFYCRDDYAHALEGKQKVEGINYGCFEFWGRENGKSFYLLIPDTHLVLNNFK